MAIKSTEGIRSFFDLQSLEIDAIKNESNKIPGKAALHFSHSDDDLAESICDSIALKITAFIPGLKAF